MAWPTHVVRWMSPEVFQSQKFGEASDIWAYGVTLVELYSQAATPYGEWSNILVLERIKDGYILPRPDDCPDNIYNNVIAPCFLEEPRQRPSFQALCTRLGTMVQLESPVASSPAMEHPQNTGGGGRVDQSALAERLPSEEGRADGFVTGGASFGFESWAEDSIGFDTPHAAVAGRRSTSVLDTGPGQSGDAIGFACFDGTYPCRGGRGTAPRHLRQGYHPQALTGQQPPKNTGGGGGGGGGGCVDQSAVAGPSSPDEGQANRIVTNGASFGFRAWAQNAIGVDTPQATVAARQRSMSAPADAWPVRSGDAMSFACDGIYSHRGGSGAAPSFNGQRYRSQASMGLQQQVYAVPPPEPAGLPSLTASIVIERTEELEEGQSVTPLEAQMFRALQHMDADDAHDHILKIRRLTDAQLSKVVKLDGVPWLATEVDLLGELPEDSRPAFRKRAHGRAKRPPNAERAQAKPHYESLFDSTWPIGDTGTLSWHSSADAERVYGVAVLEDMPQLCASTPCQPDNPIGDASNSAPGSMALQRPHFYEPRRRGACYTGGMAGGASFDIEQRTDI